MSIYFLLLHWVIHSLKATLKYLTLVATLCLWQEMAQTQRWEQELSVPEDEDQIQDIWTEALTATGESQRSKDRQV